jgi:hypothetical protein
VAVSHTLPSQRLIRFNQSSFVCISNSMGCKLYPCDMRILHPAGVEQGGRHLRIPLALNLHAHLRHLPALLIPSPLHILSPNHNGQIYTTARLEAQAQAPHGHASLLNLSASD